MKKSTRRSPQTSDIFAEEASLMKIQPRAVGNDQQPSGILGPQHFQTIPAQCPDYFRPQRFRRNASHRITTFNTNLYDSRPHDVTTVMRNGLDFFFLFLYIC
jgi:hypothetical protein